MVSTSVFKQKVTVKYLAKSEHSKSFVEFLFSVDEFVASETVNSSHVAPDEGECDESAKCLGNFIFEDPGGHETWITTTDNAHAPNPG